MMTAIDLEILEMENNRCDPIPHPGQEINPRLRFRLKIPKLQELSQHSDFLYRHRNVIFCE